MFIDQEKIEKVLYKGEEIIWCGKPHGDSFIFSVFPIFSLIWLAVSGSLMYEYFSNLAPSEASKLLHGIGLTLLVTLPTWIGIGMFFVKVYDGRKGTVYAITTQRVIKHYGVFKSHYLFTDIHAIQSITFQNDTFTHSTFQTGSLVFGLGHHEYNASSFLTRLDYLENAKDILRLFKLISLNLKNDFSFVNDPEPTDPVIEAERVKKRRKAS